MPSTRQYTCPHLERGGKKGYLKNQAAGKQNDRWHVITNRHVSIRLEQKIKEERLMKMLQQVVETAESGLYQAFWKSKSSIKVICKGNLHSNFEESK